MVERQRDECCRRPPDGNDLATDLATADADEDGKAYKPICANRSQEDLVPLRVLGFLGCDSNGGVAVGIGLFEYTSVAHDNGHEEQAAG